MSAPTSSPSDASQVHFGVGLPPLRPSQARRDNDERNPGHPPHLPGPSPPSSYLDPLITADSGHGGQLPCNQQTSVTRNDAPERATAARSNLFSIPPKPSFTSDPRGGPLIAAMGGQIDTTQKRKAEDGLIDPRLYKTPRCDSAGFSSTGTTVGQLGQNEPAVGLANTVVGTRQPILAPGIAADNDFLKSASDALIGWQLDLHDGSDEESGSENIPWGPSRYHDKDDDEPRQGRRGRGRGRGARGRGVKRGPRKAAEPTGDVKYRLNMASNAYMDRRLDEAIEWVEDAIRINAEIYQAWTLLASFLEEKGDLKGSFAARVFSCHLQPKIVDGWLSCAETGIALRDILPQDEAGILEQVTVCYSAALRADINNQEARYGRAAIAVERGQIRTAAKDYLYLLEHGEYDVHALRSYAEMTILLASTGKGDFYRLESAIDWYYRAFAHYRASAVYDRHFIEWRDVNIFAVLLAYVEHTKDALYEVKSLARWLLGRPNDNFWDDWQDDDREWDVDNTRRIGFGDFEEGKYPESSYGAGLPLDLRTKLAVYRLKLGDLNEAQHHLNYLDPEGPNGGHILSNEPHLLADLASALYESDLRAMAVRFFEPLLSVPEVLDSAILLAAGRCYLDSGDKRQAEECFSAAIDADESNDEASIDARYELAKMYEAAREEQEAYILVNEALRLQQAHDEADEDYEDEMGGYPGSDDDAQYRPSASTARKARPRTQRAPRPPKQKAPRPLVPKPSGLDSNGNTIRRPRPRRKVFGRTEEVTLEEKRRAEELTAAWRIVHSTRGSVENDTQIGPSDVFLRAAKELVDDFRSCKGFYSWEKYLIHLGIDEDKQVYVSRNRNLIEMKERLSHNLNPYGPNTERQLGERTAVSYRGVSFSEWLDLFLEYAVSLAHYERFQESYQVCESARDAEVFAKNKEDMFLIHVTWAACALRARDEETCVAAARFLMRDRQFDSDPFRMFAALCRLCPSPASWYASGPVQKYMLRQIKLMDRALVSEGGEVSEEEESKTNSGRVYPSKELDVTLLVLYGHILFVSNSFTYALNYFLRAYSIDPENQMILLSVGQCYIHYALKRQSENRQYLLVQGFVFLHRYYDIKVSSTDAAERQEAHYNMARSYHAIGIPHLAAEFYQRVLRDIPDDSDASIFGKSDLSQEAAYNLQQICWAGGDMEAVKALNARYLTL